MSTPQYPIISDLQYVHFLCGSPLIEAAAHTSTNTGRLEAELSAHPLTPYLRGVNTEG